MCGQILYCSSDLSFLRTTLKNDSAHSDIELLQPVNLELIIKRNLAASWFTKIPGVEVQGVLKSMNVGDTASAWAVNPSVVDACCQRPPLIKESDEYDQVCCDYLCYYGDHYGKVFDGPCSLDGAGSGGLWCPDENTC